MKQVKQSKQQGQSQVEYALLIALVALVGIITLVMLGPKVGTAYSQITNWAAEEEENPGHIVVRVVDAEFKGIEKVRIYAFNSQGRYLGKYGNSDAQGELTFEEMDEGSYKFRADYQGKQFWSEVINWQGEWLAVIETGQRPFTVQVVDFAQDGINNVRVYTFTANGRYIGVYGNSDSNGELIFNLSDGVYKFRADFRGNQYWSDETTSPQNISAKVETGERPFTVTVHDAAGDGIAGVRVYTFTDNGRYTGVYGNTDDSGRIVLNIPDGNFKFRADYRGNQYWSDITESPSSSAAAIETGQQSLSVSVINAQEEGLNNVRVYAFTENDRYTGVYGNTNDQGIVMLDIPDGRFKFRADYRGNQYWSDIAETPGQNTAVVKTNEQEIAISVIDASGGGINNVRVYAFTSSGRYVGTYGNTGEDGVLRLPLPDGAFKFRADYRGSQFWSDDLTTPSSSGATIETGEALSTVRTTNEDGQIVTNVRVYAFTAGGRYTGVYGNTDASGQVNLALPNGAYRFRADYRGNQYWSDSITTPGNTAVTLTTN